MQTQESIALIVPWHNGEQIDRFKHKWALDYVPANLHLYLIKDSKGEGCGKTKNRGIEAARKDNCAYFIVLDDDCYPHETDLKQFVDMHIEELSKKIKCNLYKHVCLPPSRGTPKQTYVEKQVMLCMGFWKGVPDYWASTDPKIIPEYSRRYIYNKFFSLSGMNMSFRKEVPFMFDETDRYDDTWGGWKAQKWIYNNGGCCSTNGPYVLHSRQSDRQKNQKIEESNMEQNEINFTKIAGGL